MSSRAPRTPPGYRKDATLTGLRTAAELPSLNLYDTLHVVVVVVVVVAAATTTVVVSVPTVAVAVSAPGPPAELGAPRTLNLMAPRRDGGAFLLVAAIGRPKKSTGGLWRERKRRQRNGGVHGCVK